MALIAHYPLNGDTKDYSGYVRNTTLSGTIKFSDEGKIGRCLDGGAITLPAGVMNKFRQSISFWYFNKMTTSATTTHSQFMGNSSPRDYALFAYPNNNDLHWNFRHEDNSNIFSGSRSNLLPNKKWTHVTVVNDELHFKIYINGVLEVQQVVSTWNSNVENRSFPLIHNTPQAMFNDVRIYDHALSDKEVKELAKAKVLHYKFDEYSEPTTNLLSDPKTEGFEYSGTGYSFYSQSWKISSLGLVTGDKVFLSGLLKVNSARKNAGGSVSMYIYTRNAGDSWGQSIQTSSTSLEYENKFISFTINNSFLLKDGKPATDIVVSIYHMPNSIDTGSSFVKNLQFEISNKPTPFVVGTRQGGVKDCSGFGNDGIVAAATAPSWSEDSPVGRGSMEFSGAQEIDTQGTFNFGKEDFFTISVWVKPEDHSSKDGAAAGILGKGHWHNNTWDLFIRNSNSIAFECSGDPTRNGLLQVTSPVMAMNTWANVAVVYNAGLVSMYVNGVLYSTATYNGIGGFTNPNRVYVGKRAGDNTRRFMGNISDVRIYATALTPEDILELYQTRASVDNEGNLFVQEIDEISDTSKEVDSRGIARFKEFSEVGGENKMSIKNDGVVYVNEIMEA